MEDALAAVTVPSGAKAGFKPDIFCADPFLGC